MLNELIGVIIAAFLIGCLVTSLTKNKSNIFCAWVTVIWFAVASVRTFFVQDYDPDLKYDYELWTATRATLFILTALFVWRLSWLRTHRAASKKEGN